MNRILKTGVRFPAEWENEGFILLSWPHADTDWNYMLDDVRRCYSDMIGAISRYEKIIVVSPDCSDVKSYLGEYDSDRIFFIDIPTNDTWIRDYGALTVIDSNGQPICLDFCFNGWGLKFASCFDNLVTSRMKSSGLITADVVNCRNFVLEGGGIESDGNGLLMTTSTCQLSANRNSTLTRQEIEQKLLEYFGGKKVLWLNHGYLAGDDTDSHIDTLARFAPHNGIVFTGCDNPADEHFDELNEMKSEVMDFRTLSGNPFNLFELPLPDPIFDEDGERLPATYANFLALPTAVVMPTYGQPRKDQLAKQILEVAYERPVIGVDCTALIQQHGSLHCATMQIPKNALAL